MRAHIVELLGILIALCLLIFLAFRGFTLLLAAIVGEPTWTYGSRSEIARSEMRCAYVRSGSKTGNTLIEQNISAWTPKADVCAFMSTQHDKAAGN